MSGHSEVFERLLACLEVVVFEHREGSGLRRISALPDWFSAVFGNDEATLDQRCDFLEFFLGQARDHWSGENAGELLRSGIWEEGGEHFEAMAISVGDAQVIAIDRGGKGFEEYASRVQRSNELSLERARSNRETQRRVVLLDCVVHDLSNPMATVLVNLQYLAKRLPEGPERKAAEMALEQVERQRAMLRSVVGLFSAGADDGAGERVADAGAAVRAAVRAQLDGAMGCGVALVAEVGKGEFPVVARSSHLLRAIENLVVNAVRHSPNGGTVTVRVNADGEDGVLISVEDEGEGVDPELGARLFEPFERQAERGGQAGLGLFFCKRVVERWGGSIGHEANQPRGARFWMRLRRCSE